MAFISINPANGARVAEYPVWDSAGLEAALAQAAEARAPWAAMHVEQRGDVLRSAARVLRARREELARTITLEMGKLIQESRAEVEKCAVACEYYAAQGPAFIADEVIASDADKSYVAYQPLGMVLAIMPWNFPFWQVFRFAVPALVAGNSCLLKHASNVPRCALAIESVWREAGLPEGVFRTLMIDIAWTEQVIADPRVRAVTLTGSETAGRKVAALAGKHLKKAVLELGGSDPFIVLEDADLDLTVPQAIASRFLNAGQSCIAAKRIIVADGIAERFVAAFKAGVEQLAMGDPLDEATTLAPLARADLREELHRQVSASLAAGAVAVTGCAPGPGPGFFYTPSILDHVRLGMPAGDEELFGPAAAVMRARDEEEALRLANATRFGLGASVWTRDAARGERFARRIESGMCFVNGMVKSDPRLPFGGIKDSGYGRELSRQGLHEFVNAKTMWITERVTL